jgi:hypothetical protein
MSLQEPIAAPAVDGRADFDFFIGRWRVSHRRLAGRLVGSTRWEDFGGITETRKILGGLGNMDENVLELPAGTYQAITVRLFDPARALWTIYWIDGRQTAVDPPMIGRFVDGAGEFFGDETLDGRAIRVRFRWFVDDPDHCRWEQAFSPDAGETWETNWTMAFERM